MTVDEVKAVEVCIGATVPVRSQGHANCGVNLVRTRSGEKLRRLGSVPG